MVRIYFLFKIGNGDAIGYAAIAIPSLRSLRIYFMYRRVIMTDEKKKNEHKTDKHHGQAGDGNDLIPIKADGTPAKYDKYGNLVTENTGKGKGIMLKQSYQTASKNIANFNQVQNRFF